MALPEPLYYVGNIRTTGSSQPPSTSEKTIDRYGGPSGDTIYSDGSRVSNSDNSIYNYLTNNSTLYDFNTLGKYIQEASNISAAASDRANALSYQSAKEATEANMLEAQRNRDFQWQSLMEQQRYNSAEAKLTRDFEERMSNTSHQRAVQDMIKAGINPILAYQNSASTPNGAMATTGTATGAQGSAHSYTAQQEQLGTKIAEWSFLMQMLNSGLSAIKGLPNKIGDSIINGLKGVKKTANAVSNKVDNVKNVAHGLQGINDVVQALTSDFLFGIAPNPKNYSKKMKDRQGQFYYLK